MSLPSTTTMRREEVSRMLAIIRPLPEFGSNKETAETVGGGGDWILNCGWRLFYGDWRRQRTRGRQTRGWWRPRLPRTPGTYLNLLMAARLAVKSVAFRLTGTIILCVIRSCENCSTRRGKLTAKIIFHDFAQEKNYLRLFEYIFPQVAK